MQLAELDKRAQRFARRILKHYHSKVMRKGQRFADLDAVQHHQLHNRCKLLRCAVEFFAELYDDKRQQVYISRLAAVQNVLGALDDGRMAEHLITQLPAACQTASAVDLVRGWTAARVHAHLNQFDRVWEAFSTGPQFWN